MTGGLAHEIRNPLSTLALNAELLAEGIEELAAPQEESLRLRRRIDALRRETERLRGILEDFLQYAGELHLERVPADVREVVEELADFFHPQADQQGVRLRADLNGGPLVCDVDVPHLKQAILNLLLNAVQAMSRSDGGQRELLLRVVSRQLASGEDGACIEVIDTGPGIPAEKLDQIFRPYFTTKAGGTGLGLPTSRRIIEAHGGQMEVHSEPGRGTAFTIFLPLHEAATDG